MKIKDNPRALVDLIRADKFDIEGACPEHMQCSMRHLSEINDRSMVCCNMRAEMNDEFNPSLRMLSQRTYCKC